MKTQGVNENSESSTVDVHRSIGSPVSSAPSGAEREELLDQVRGRATALWLGFAVFAAAIVWCTWGGAIGTYSKSTSGPGWVRYEYGTNPEMPVALGAVGLSLVWILIAWLSWRSAKAKLQ